MSRVAVWNKVKSGKIRAQKVEAQYVIAAQDANVALARSDARAASGIHDAVGRVVKEYGPVLKRLSHE